MGGIAMQKTRLFAGAAAILVALAGTAAAQSLAKIKVLLPVTNIDEAYAPYMIAKEVGYYAAEGLDVDLVPTNGGNQVLLQIAAGNGDIGTISPTDLIAGIQPGIGMKVQVFYDVYYRNIWSVSVVPDSPITKLADLKGKKIGVSAMGSSGVAHGKAYLAKEGVEIGKDGTSYIAIGVGAQGATALRTKQVDAVVYWDAMLAKLDVVGFKLRQLPVDEAIRNLPDISMGASLETIEKRPQVVAGFGRALAKGYEFNQANREAAVRITWKHFPASKPANMSEEEALKNALVVNETRMRIWTSLKTGGKHGMFIAEDWRNVVQFAKDHGVVPASADAPLEKLYTNKFVEEMNKFDRDAVTKQAKALDPKTIK
jgi:NitT/TauT family transport system substrate-binding protein